MADPQAFATARAGDLDGLRSRLADDPELVAVRAEHGVTLLHVSAELDDVQMTELLLGLGAELEAETAWGHTPFEWAVTVGSTEVAKLLMGAGASRINLWTAAGLGLDDVVTSCFEGEALRPGAGRSPPPGADLTGWPEDTPYRKGDEISDAFYIACRNGHKATAELLLSRGADIDATGYFGATALHWAAINGHAAVVEWLAERGADSRRDSIHFTGLWSCRTR